MNILIPLFTILFFFLAWRRLDLAAMFLIAALPSYLIRFNILGLPSTLLEVMIWVVFLVWLIVDWPRVKENLRESFKKNSNKVKIRYPFDWEMVLILLIAFIAAGIAGFSFGSLGVWKAYFFEPVLFFMVILNVMKGEKGREKILWSLAVSALIVSALAIYQKITGQFIDNPDWAAAGTRRVVSFFGYPNAVGLYLGPIILVMTGWLIGTVKNFQFSIFNFQTIFNVKIFKPVFMTLVIILSVFSIYFAKSKGALMGVAAGLAVFGLLAGRKASQATIIFLILIGISLAAYQPVRDLAVRNITLTNLSGQIRQAGWSDTWKMLKDGRILTGAGLANFQKTVAAYHTEGIFVKDFSDPDFQRKLVFNETYRTAHWQPLEIYLYPHNIFLNFWSELGLAGLLLFVWIILKYLYLGVKSYKLRVMSYEFINIGLISAMVAIIVHGLVDVPYFKNDLAVMFWLLMAMMSMINLSLPPLTKGDRGI